MTIKEWVSTQSNKNTLSLVIAAFKQPRTGTTPPDIVQVPREQWDSQKRSAIRYVMAQAEIAFADLQNAVTVRNKLALWVRGLAEVNDKTDVLATYIPVFWLAYDEYRSTDISEENDDTYPVDEGSQPIYGDSPAVANDWQDLINAEPSKRGDVIEAAMQS